MSIKIVPQEQLEQQNDKVSLIHKVPLLFYPVPKTLYSQRLSRLQFLVKDSPFADYLNFCSKIVAQQAKLVETMPISQNLTESIDLAIKKNIAPLSIENYPLTLQWLDYLYPIMDAVSDVNESITKTINNLKQNSKEQLLDKASQLLAGQFDAVDSNESLFIWSALSTYYSQLASQLPGKAVAEFGEQRWLCPVCQSSPVASIVHLGNNIGLRYLHCSLCESEWHVPRAKCTNCDNLQDITYYALDNELAAIKTECCDHCHSYLKIFSQERDPHLDVVADDIYSLLLDMETEKEQFSKSGVNPLLFSV
ncbi:Tat proofreading chaperone FdhE [Orbus hercynius]|uniref:Protein FdhE homolog n=1 Tax=Orbus hercynius TaxID=593135 RepID=A0A495RB55_9GAMM|nr:formate dehydrogenase accessory protein FdhE [Orbus hercynius]RKS84629.1 Tat proofreading chaperone FdhE [Orbus hercynius]